MRDVLIDVGRRFLKMKGDGSKFYLLSLDLVGIMNNRNLKVLERSHTMIMTTIIKERNMHMAITPLELTALSYVQPRMNLSNVDRVRLRNLRKGYEGERKLYAMLEENLPPNYLILTDLLLKQHQTEFQIDLLLIGNDTLYPLEVKNYEGDYVIQGDNWYAAQSQHEIRNPLHQLKRSELLLQQFLKTTSFRFSVESHIIFVNPAFSLYQAPLDIPAIFPTQINQFIKRLQSSPFNQTARHQELAAYLTNQNLARSSREKLPDYHYEKLRKGIVCASCTQFMERVNRKYVICRSCEQTETTEFAVKRSISEFTTLFPNKKITTRIIHEWCGIIESKKVIQRILKKYYRPIGVKNHTYYVDRENFEG